MLDEPTRSVISNSYSKERVGIEIGELKKLLV